MLQEMENHSVTSGANSGGEAPWANFVTEDKVPFNYTLRHWYIFNLLLRREKGRSDCMWKQILVKLW